MSENRDLKQEQKRVDYVIDEIDRRLSKLEDKSGTLKQDIVSLRKNFWEDVTVNLDDPDDVIETHASLKQQAEFLAERERTHGQMFKQWDNLTRLKYSPYFGRIDFKEEGESNSEPIYIGLFSLMDKDDENFLIYDWRAPISSMYYDYAPGPAQYETMDGEIKGEIELKRQYIIRDGKIKGMFDTGITIGDEILQQVLSGQADTQMKSIVATIQREQNKIIRHIGKKYLIVLGAAGSGKTSAALQRVAYLLYRHRNHLKSDNILLFSPNPMFNSYVSSVLPELGEENMQQATFYQYLSHRLGKRFNLEHPYGQLEYMLSNQRDHTYKIRHESIQIKSSLLFKDLIDRYVDELSREGMVFRDIQFRGEVIVTAEKLSRYFYQLDPSISIANRLDLVKDWLYDKLDQLEKEEVGKDWVVDERELMTTSEYQKVYRKLQRERRFTEDTFDDFEREEKMLAEWIVRRKIRPLRRKISQLLFVDIEKIYQDLFYWAKNQNAIENASMWDDVIKLTLKQMEEQNLLYEDATPFLYLMDRIKGRQVFSNIRHLFIDEAQDYSPFQFAYFQYLFPHSQMTILGDINQSIFTHSVHEQNGLKKADQLFPEGERESIILAKSYRSTKEIVEFTEELLDRELTIEPFNRHGRKPLITHAESEAQLNEAIVNKVKELQHAGHETIAIICKTQKEALHVHERLSKEMDAKCIRKETNSYDKGVSIIPSYLAKGIEFDAVIVYNCSEEIYRYEDERNLLYTVCTRAMHELYLYSLGEVSPLIKTVSPNKYIENK